MFLNVKNRAERTLATGEGVRFPVSNFHITYGDESENRAFISMLKS